MGTRTCTWAHNLGFPDGFDDEEEEEEGEVSEGKATSFGCGVCSVRLPVLQILSTELLEIDSKLHFLIVHVLYQFHNNL